MTPSQAREQPFDITDESLLRWHFTNLAEKRFDYTRREAELLFRENHPKIVRFINSAVTRNMQEALMIRYLEEI